MHQDVRFTNTDINRAGDWSSGPLQIMNIIYALQLIHMVEQGLVHLID